MHEDAGSYNPRIHIAIIQGFLRQKSFETLAEELSLALRLRIVKFPRAFFVRQFQISLVVGWLAGVRDATSHHLIISQTATSSNKPPPPIDLDFYQIPPLPKTKKKSHRTEWNQLMNGPLTPTRRSPSPSTPQPPENSSPPFTPNTHILSLANLRRFSATVISMSALLLQQTTWQRA